MPPRSIEEPLPHDFERIAAFGSFAHNNDTTSAGRGRKRDIPLPRHF